MKSKSFEKPLKKPPNTSRLEKDVLTPFGDKKDMNLYIDIENKIKSNEEAL